MFAGNPDENIAGKTLNAQPRTNMKFTKTLTVMACAVAFLLSTSGAMAESCCVKAKAKGKACDHKCCVAAHKDGKLCEKCQTDANNCCDKAIAAGKECTHKCCVAALKAGKACEKCNPTRKDTKKEEK